MKTPRQAKAKPATAQSADDPNAPRSAWDIMKAETAAKIECSAANRQARAEARSEMTLELRRRTNPSDYVPEERPTHNAIGIDPYWRP